MAMDKIGYDPLELETYQSGLKIENRLFSIAFDIIKPL